MIDPQEVLAAWTLTSRSIRVADAGTNNRSYIVETVTGSYYLRVYLNTNDLERIRYEHALLLQLRQTRPSFAVPLPLSTNTGRTYAVITEDDHAVIAALFPVISGREATRGDVAEAAICGEALGELDTAMACIEIEPTLAGLPWLGQPGAVHPMVPDPLTAIARLSLASETRDQVRALLSDLITAAPRLYARLPQQVIHGDFYPSNVLMEGKAVSGVLDFEFASPGPRAMDFAVGLWAFGIAHWRTGEDWPLIAAFAAGFRRRIALTPVEIDALPTLIHLREATSLIHWIGRFRQGLTNERDIEDRTNRFLNVDDWIRTHGGELVHHVAAATS